MGTRGGAADHAAIKLSHRGYVTRVSFFPFQIGSSARFFPTHDLVVCNSGVYAGKSHHARNTFNEKVTAYHVGRVWCKMLRPDLAPCIQHLRDISQGNLGLSQAAFAQLLGQLPARLTRAQVQAAFPQMGEVDRDQLERLFQSHDAPAHGYAVRDMVLFGLSEMARADRCLELLQSSAARGLGRLMIRSHDGDRVSRQTGHNTWRRVSFPWTGRTGSRFTPLDRLPRTLPRSALPREARCGVGTRTAGQARRGSGGGISVRWRPPVPGRPTEASTRPR